MWSHRWLKDCIYGVTEFNLVLGEVVLDIRKIDFEKFRRVDTQRLLSNCGPGTELDTYVIKQKLFTIKSQGLHCNIITIKLQRGEMKIQRLNHLLQLLQAAKAEL